MTLVLDVVRSGLREVEGRPGWFQPVIDGETVGEPIRGFSSAMRFYRNYKGINTTGCFADGVEGGCVPGTLNHQG